MTPATGLRWVRALADELPDLTVTAELEGANLRVVAGRGELSTTVLYPLEGLTVELVLANTRLLTSDWPEP